MSPSVGARQPARGDLAGQRLQRRHRGAERVAAEQQRRRPRRRPAPPPRRAPAPSPRRPAPAGRGGAPGAGSWAASSSSSSATGRSEKNFELLVEQPVVELHPVLVELVRRRLGRVEPQPGAGRLAELAAVGRRQQRPRQRVDGRAGACAGSGRRRTRMLPHWSEPPICSSQPRWSCSQR